MTIGVDVGGTTTRVAAVDADGRLVAVRRAPTPGNGDALVGLLSATIREVLGETNWKSQDECRIGIALPGIVDGTTGSLIRSVNLPWLEGRNIAAELRRVLGARVHVGTDAEAATWGEFATSGGADEGFAHLRLGTGVACGIALKGELVPTDSTRRTHWELLVVDRSEDAPNCPCGLRGCLELFASGKALGEKARANGFDGLADLDRAAAAGQMVALSIVEAARSAAARAIANLAERFPIRMLALGGGVIENMPILVERFVAHSTTSWPFKVRVIRAALGDDAGVIGAALLARKLAV